MSIEKELQNLKYAFNKVAEAIQHELPDVWKATVDLCEDDDVAVRFLCEPSPFLEGKSPVELANASPEGKQQVLTFLQQIAHGVYI